MGSSGGGHGSGEVSYPDFIKTDAEKFLNSIEGWVTTGSPALEDDNPYEDVGAYSTSSRVGQIMAVTRDFRTFVTELDHLGAADAIASQAEALADNSGTLVSDGEISNAVTQFHGREQASADRSLAILKSGYNAIGAVNSSSFALAQALLLEEVDRRTAGFSAELAIEAGKLKLNYVLENMKGMLQAYFNINDMRKSLVVGEIDSYAKILIAEKEQHDSDVRINVKERLWPLQLHAYWANAFASIGGGTGMSSQEWESSTEKSGLFGWGTFLF
jgi:hypothetical protein